MSERCSKDELLRLIAGSRDLGQDAGAYKCLFERLHAAFEICDGLAACLRARGSRGRRGFRHVWSTGEQVDVALLARAGLAWQSGGQWFARWLAPGFVLRCGGAEAVQRGEDGLDVVKSEKAIGAATKLARGLGTAKEQEAQQGCFITTKVQNGAGTVFVALHAGAVVSGDEVLVFKRAESGVDVALVELQNGLARRLLVSGGDKRVE